MYYQSTTCGCVPAYIYRTMPEIENEGLPDYLEDEDIRTNNDTIVDQQQGSEDISSDPEWDTQPAPKD